MQFDITTIDKKLLLQSLYIGSTACGLGVCEYAIRKTRGENVDTLSDEECETALLEFTTSNVGNYRIFDYHKGKPLKINFCKKKNGRIIADTYGYDSRNGRYQFFKIMLDTFPINEIKIIKKTYSPNEDDIKKHENTPSEEIVYYKEKLKLSTKHKDVYGTFWKLSI
ncbi:MAG: hypothetical protein H6Q15_2172 [Bacteroidetes bacterium]|nr:hypothetical protein [Bacteroidota bacterium]